MNRVLDEIRAQVNTESLINSCRDKGCNADMTNIPSDRVVIHVEDEFDSRNMDGQRCDRLLFYISTTVNDLIAAPIELKGGNVDASEAFQQLQAGANFAQHLTLKITKTVCFPLLFYEKIHKVQLTKLRRYRVRFRDKDLPIQIKRCGGRLTQVLPV